MNSKLWIRKALSTCLVVATMATYSMVTLANSEKIAGELTISSKNASAVKVNGEVAQNGRSIFSSSTIATPENTSAVINVGKAGKVELAPNTILTLSFSEKGISGDLVAGRITVLNASESVNVKTPNGTIVKLNAGETATANGQAQDDDDSTGGGGGSWLVWALVLGGAAAGIIIAATSDNNRVSLGGGTTVVSPTR
jgi:hypothetical protein